MIAVLVGCAVSASRGFFALARDRKLPEPLTVSRATARPSGERVRRARLRGVVALVATGPRPSRLPSFPKYFSMFCVDVDLRGVRDHGHLPAHRGGRAARPARLGAAWWLCWIAALVGIAVTGAAIYGAIYKVPAPDGVGTLTAAVACSSSGSSRRPRCPRAQGHRRLHRPAESRAGAAQGLARGQGHPGEHPGRAGGRGGGHERRGVPPVVLALEDRRDGAGRREGRQPAAEAGDHGEPGGVGPARRGGRRPRPRPGSPRRSRRRWPRAAASGGAGAPRTRPGSAPRSPARRAATTRSVTRPRDAGGAGDPGEARARPGDAGRPPRPAARPDRRRPTGARRPRRRRRGSSTT